MKKIIVSIALLLTINCTLFAQGGEQRGGGARGAEMMKQRLKEELKFSDVKVDSIAAIQQEFQMKSRDLRTNTSLSDDQKKAKMDVYDAERKARLKPLLTDEEMKKLEDYLENMRKMRQQRQQ